MTEDASVIGLDFDDNEISIFTPDPLQFFKNLERFSVASNQIIEIPKDFIRSPTKLKHLNLSNNALEEVDEKMFKYLKELQSLDLSHNKFRKVSSELLAALNRVERLNLEGNLIFDIEDLDDDTDDSHEDVRVPERHLNIKELNLAKNNFAVITAKTFADFDKL